MSASQIRQLLIDNLLGNGYVLDTANSDKLSKYFEKRKKGKLEMNIVRISNHCTNVATWQQRYGGNNPSLQLSNKQARRYKGKYDGLNNKYFYKNFYSIVIYDPKEDGMQTCDDIKENNIFINQSTYNAANMTEENIRELISSVNSLNESIKHTNIMNKIRITESQLHRVIKKSVNRLLNNINDYPHLYHL
jgi:hypothetical protein